MSRRTSVRHTAPIGGAKTYCGLKKTPARVTGGTRPCARCMAAKRKGGRS